jgi:transcription initiation factor TFIID subunit 3
VLVEGGECPSIFDWEERRRIAGQKSPEPNGLQDQQPEENGDGDGEQSRPSSSGLSSLGDRNIADDMDLS